MQRKTSELPGDASLLTLREHHAVASWHVADEHLGLLERASLLFLIAVVGGSAACWVLWAWRRSLRGPWHELCCR
jgi:hypothetical protein